MAVNTAKLIEDAESFSNYLTKSAEYENGHLTHKEDERIDCLHAIGVQSISDDGTEITCIGHVYGPRVTEEIKYELVFIKGAVPDITVINKVQDKEAAIQFLHKEISAMKKKYAKKKGGGNAANMKGYYLWSEPQGIPGQATFAKALKEGLVSEDFVATCKKINVSMRLYGAKRKTSR